MFSPLHLRRGCSLCRLCPSPHSFPLNPNLPGSIDSSPSLTPQQLLSPLPSSAERSTPGLWGMSLPLQLCVHLPSLLTKRPGGPASLALVSWCLSSLARSVLSSLFIPDLTCVGCAEHFLCSRCWAHSDEQSSLFPSSGSRQSDGGGGHESSIPLVPTHDKDGYSTEVQQA